MKSARCFLSSLLLLSLLLTSCSSSLSPLTEDEGKEAVRVQETEEAETSTEESILQEYDPSEDEVMNILMIGNSYCYYYVEELYGIAKAAGVDMNIYNVYYSGCPLNKHWEWYRLGESHYQFFRTDKNGRRKIKDPANLLTCLQTENWDVISLQEGGASYRRSGIEGLRQEIDLYLGKLLEVIQKQYPMSKYYWHCTWVPQVGFQNENQGFSLDTKEQEIAYQNDKITVGYEIAEKYGLSLIPTGAAWLEARYHPAINNTLCLREAKIKDLTHDGDIGGGQYLNACVWFEVLTGKSCIGNSFRPDYDLSEEKIAILQEAAHKAVQSL